MQEQILEAYPAADVRVYVIWLSMLPQDSHARWDGGLMPDGPPPTYGTRSSR
ncbi:MAG: hypothetical protein AB7N70_29090 [Dehalococcoidia bacterium]